MTEAEGTEHLQLIKALCWLSNMLSNDYLTTKQLQNYSAQLLNDFISHPQQLLKFLKLNKTNNFRWMEGGMCKKNT